MSLISCSVPSCTRRRKYSSFCGRHRKLNNGERVICVDDCLNLAVKNRTRCIWHSNIPQRCLFPGCPRTKQTSPYCRQHESAKTLQTDDLSRVTGTAAKTHYTYDCDDSGDSDSLDALDVDERKQLLAQIQKSLDDIITKYRFLKVRCFQLARRHNKLVK